MPESWQPGQNLKIPDPNDPSGTNFIEIPASELEIVGEVGSPKNGAQIEPEIN